MIVYDAIGRTVATLVNEHMESEMYHQKMFDASALSSGMYFARLSSDRKHMLRKMLLLK